MAAQSDFSILPEGGYTTTVRALQSTENPGLWVVMTWPHKSIHIQRTTPVKYDLRLCPVYQLTFLAVHFAQNKRRISRLVVRLSSMAHNPVGSRRHGAPSGHRCIYSSPRTHQQGHFNKATQVTTTLITRGLLGRCMQPRSESGAKGHCMHSSWACSCTAGG